ncbi:MAG: STAS domain-containing protein [Streptosporangiaceae bacterium]|jgi:anti-anti-sigma factor
MVMLAVELSISERDDSVVVALRGDLDVTGVPDTQSAIAALMARSQWLVIDMSALDFIDCAALGILLGAQRLARRSGGDVILAAPQSHARRLLALTGQGETFWIQASVAVAVAGIPGRRRRYPWRRRPVSTVHSGRAAPSPTCTG